MSGLRLEWDIPNYSVVVRSLLDISVEAEKSIRDTLKRTGREVAKSSTASAQSMPRNLGVGSFGKRRVSYQGGPLRAARQRATAGPVKYSSRTDSMLKLVIRSPLSGPEARAATIAEFAKNAKSPQGSALVGVLQSRFGQPGRIVYETWDTRYPQTLKDVQADLDRAAETINKVTA
jgi:hypothetical protein